MSATTIRRRLAAPGIVHRLAAVPLSMVVLCCLMAAGANAASVTTGSEVVEIARNAVTLTGTVDPEGEDTHYYFQYGRTEGYGQYAPSPPGLDAGEGAAPVEISTRLVHLVPATLYHYRLVGRTPEGTLVTGEDHTFVTGPPTPPAVTTGPASEVVLTAAVLTGTIEPKGLETSYVLELGADTAYGTSIAGEAGSTSGSVTISVPLIDLAPAPPTTTGSWRLTPTAVHMAPIERSRRLPTNTRSCCLPRRHCCSLPPSASRRSPRKPPRRATRSRYAASRRGAASTRDTRAGRRNDMPTTARGRAPSKRTAPAARHQVATSNGIARKRLTDIQRARLVAAMTEAVCEHGVADVTVAGVVQRAGVSRRTFYEIFADAEDCFLATFDEALEKMVQVVVPAYEAESRWRERMRAGLGALLRFLDEDRAAGRLLAMEALGARRAAAGRRADIVACAIDAVEEGAREPKAAPTATRLTAEGVVGAVLAVLHSRLLEDGAEPLSGLLNSLMSMIVLPYRGPAAARRELSCPPVTAGACGRASGVDSLKDLHMRLTYRTVRVLSAVASHPGASNRAIGEAADVTDQGQISKLLSRLERLGLIENAGAATARGEPNAWTLTQRGWAIHATLAP